MAAGSAPSTWKSCRLISHGARHSATFSNVIDVVGIGAGALSSYWASESLRKHEFGAYFGQLVLVIGLGAICITGFAVLEYRASVKASTDGSAQVAPKDVQVRGSGKR